MICKGFLMKNICWVLQILNVAVKHIKYKKKTTHKKKEKEKKKGLNLVVVCKWVIISNVSVISGDFSCGDFCF